MVTYQLKEWVLLVSLAGCQEQATHSDFEPDDAMKDLTPFSVIVALQNNTTLVVWPYSHRIHYANDAELTRMKISQRKVLELQTGDAVIFRGDLIHAGSAYNKRNYRLHCYVDILGQSRAQNTTYLTAPNFSEAQLKLIELTK